MDFINKLRKCIENSEDIKFEIRDFCFKDKIKENNDIKDVMNIFLDGYLQCICKFKSLSDNNKVNLFLKEQVEIRYSDLFRRINFKKIELKKLKIILKSLNIFVEDAISSDDYYVLMNNLIDVPMTILERFDKLGWLDNYNFEDIEKINVDRLSRITEEANEVVNEKINEKFNIIIDNACNLKQAYSF